jgi:hypothetical protein
VLQQPTVSPRTLQAQLAELTSASPYFAVHVKSQNACLVCEHEQLGHAVIAQVSRCGAENAAIVGSSCNVTGVFLGQAVSVPMQRLTGPAFAVQVSASALFMVLSVANAIARMAVRQAFGEF